MSTARVEDLVNAALSDLIGMEVGPQFDCVCVAVRRVIYREKAQAGAARASTQVRRKPTSGGGRVSTMASRRVVSELNRQPVGRRSRSPATFTCGWACSARYVWSSSYSPCQADTASVVAEALSTISAIRQAVATKSLCCAQESLEPSPRRHALTVFGAQITRQRRIHLPTPPAPAGVARCARART